MLTTSKPRNNTLIHIPNITHTSCIKYLGVYTDEHLDWHNLVETIPISLILLPFKIFKKEYEKFLLCNQE